MKAEKKVVDGKYLNHPATMHDTQYISNLRFVLLIVFGQIPAIIFGMRSIWLKATNSNWLRLHFTDDQMNWIWIFRKDATSNGIFV